MLKKAPIQLERCGDQVNITAYVNFTGNAADKVFTNGYTYSETAAASIESNWSGKFKIYGQSIHVETKVFVSNVCNSPNKILKPVPRDPGQRFLKIKILDGTIISKIMRSHEKLSWLGVVKNDESISKWSVTKSSSPLTIYVTTNYQGVPPYKRISKSSFEGLAAHEFGHALGLGDAYNAGYRGGKFPWTLDGYYAPGSYNIQQKSGETYTVTVPDNDMMIFNGEVSDNDMRMVLEAFITGQQQLFPLGSKEWLDR